MQAIRKPYNSNYKTLSVYEKALEFVKDICGIIDGFHDELMREKIQVSAYSVTTNIAESRATMYCGKEFSHLNVAIGSISESKALLEMALVRGFVDYEKFQQMNRKANELLRMAFGLVKKINQNGANIDVYEWRVDDFCGSHLYKRSIDLMQSIYWLVDDVEFNISDKDWKRAYEIAIGVPTLIASGIGQLNMKVRNRNFNRAKNILIDLEFYLTQFQNSPSGLSEYFNDIEKLRIQVMRLLNNYFGRLNSSNKVEQV